MIQIEIARTDLKVKLLLRFCIKVVLSRLLLMVAEGEGKLSYVMIFLKAGV